MDARPTMSSVRGPLRGHLVRLTADTARSGVACPACGVDEKRIQGILFRILVEKDCGEKQNTQNYVPFDR